MFVCELSIFDMVVPCAIYVRRCSLEGVWIYVCARGEKWYLLIASEKRMDNSWEFIFVHKWGFGIRGVFLCVPERSSDQRIDDGGRSMRHQSVYLHLKTKPVKQKGNNSI